MLAEGGWHQSAKFVDRTLQSSSSALSETNLSSCLSGPNCPGAVGTRTESGHWGRKKRARFAHDGMLEMTLEKK